MAADIVKPLLLLDVDGVLAPLATSSGKRPEGYQTHRMRPSGFNRPGQKPLRVWLNPQHGEWLLELTDLYELTWCTTWEHEANVWIAPHLGLPELPVVEFGKALPRPDARVHWKTATIVEYAAGRPFVWVDDELDGRDVQYFKKNCTQKFSTLRVPPLKGLTYDNVQDLKHWHHEWETWTKAWALVATSEKVHEYLSTGCWHGDMTLPDGRTGHEYCQGETGICGDKVPASCKFCLVRCSCECHEMTEKERNDDKDELDRPSSAPPDDGTDAGTG